MSNQHPDTTDASTPAETPPTLTGTKRAYRQPTLTELGSVRDLTLGATGSIGDGSQLQPSGG